MFEYVMSGVAHCRVTYESCFSNTETLAAVNSAMKMYQGAFGHVHSFLYNGYTEKKIGENFNLYNRAALHGIHADSGGLQVITRGEDITPQLKQDVYRHQAKYSDIAMSFDEIPLSVKKNAQSGIGDIDNRFFDYEKFVGCAERSADNLEEQIDYLQEHGGRSRPLLIAHGNNIEDFRRWVDIILQRIPEWKHQYIAGLSLAGTALGSGMAEIIERLFAFSEIEAPDSMKKHLHLLGVGSIARMAPCSAFVMSGLFKGVHISYDSTTHAAGVTRGTRVTKQGRIQQYGRNDHMLLKRFRDNIEEYYPGWLDPLEDGYLFEILTNSRKPIFAKHGDWIKHWYHLTYFLATQTSILNSIQIIHGNATSHEHLSAYCAKKKMTYLLGLTNVTDRQSFDAWLTHARSEISSARVGVLDTNNKLGDFVDMSHLENYNPPVIKRRPPGTVPDPKADLGAFLD